MPRHVSLGVRKAFVLRLAHLETAAAHELQRDNLHNDLRWEVAKRFLDLIAERQLPPEESKERLDYFVDRTLKDPALVREPVKPPDAVDKALATLRSRAGVLNCDSCVQGNSLTPCNGDTLHDYEVVARCGACIDRIKCIYQVVLDLATDHYWKAVNVRPPRVELETNVDTPEPVGNNVLAFGGKVSFRDDCKGTAANIEISVDVVLLDQGNLDLLPYIIAHEIYCHLFQNIQGSGPRRNWLAAYDTLAEGWMDYLVAEIVGGSPEATDYGPFGNSSVAAAGRQFHEARRSRGGYKPFRHAGRVRLGFEAAFAVLALFRRQDRDIGAKWKQRAWDDFRDLSLQLNAHPWTSEERSVALADLPKRIKQGGYIVDALGKWRMDRKIAPVIETLKDTCHTKRNLL